MASAVVDVGGDGHFARQPMGEGGKKQKVVGWLMAGLDHTSGASYNIDKITACQSTYNMAGYVFERMAQPHPHINNA